MYIFKQAKILGPVPIKPPSLSKEVDLSDCSPLFEGRLVEASFSRAIHAIEMAMKFDSGVNRTANVPKDMFVLRERKIVSLIVDASAGSQKFSVDALMIVVTRPVIEGRSGYGFDISS